MDRLYRCKNGHYIEQSTENNYVSCEICGINEHMREKLYVAQECTIVNRKSGKSWSNKLPQLLPAVQS